ncbi:MAG: response regulator, partial [Deltaproteobacteria bacterium]|nr:response regulator [Deltaproteobacteria bacterium]
LIVEDDEAIRTQMKWALDDDYAVLLAEDRESALQGFQAEDPAIVILDLGLPPVPRGPDEGFQTLAEILSIDPGAKVIVITGNHEKKTALRAVDLGAFDFFAKPADMNEVRFVLKRALHMATLERENLALKKTAYRQGFEEIIAGSRVMKELFTLVRKVSTTDASVLLVGESGTGKELVAKAIHRLSSRSQAPFIAINCGAIPEALLESELFGHEKGSFTGAYAQKKGRIEYADGGTLFLDEIGDLTLPLQVKLLRFLQERQIERVGGHEKIPVDVRVVAAT